MRVSDTSIALLIAAALAGAQPDERTTVGDRARLLTRDAAWTRVLAVPMKFNSYHPQGLVKIGETLFISSVEITVATRRFATAVDGFDRDQGEGVGHLLVANTQGMLLADITLGEGAIYHPGGIDYDGKDIWVPVAEYRPN